MASSDEIRSLCRTAIETTARQYGWRGRWDEEQFDAEIEAEVQDRLPHVRRRSLEQVVADAAKFCYARRWYEACRSAEPFERNRAFEGLWEYLFRFVHKRVRFNRDLAQDIAQKTVETVWLSLDKVQTPGAFIAYVQQIALRTLWATLEKEEMVAGEEEEEAVIEPRSEEAVDEERGLARAKEILRRCLDNEKQLRLMEEHVLHGRSLRDVAEEMGITPNYGYVLKNRAIRRLQECEELAELRAEQETAEPEDGSLLQIRLLLQVIEGVTEGAECEECRRWLPEYVERETSGFDVAQQYPEVRRHLDRCRSCEREYIFLLEAALEEQAGDLAAIDVPPPDLSFLPPLSFADYVRGLIREVAGSVQPALFPSMEQMLEAFFEGIGRTSGRRIPAFQPMLREGEDDSRYLLRLAAAVYDATHAVASHLTAAEIARQRESGELVETLRREIRRAAARQGLLDEEVDRLAQAYIHSVWESASLLRDVATDLPQAGSLYE